VTHDIGNMVGYAFAAQYPGRVIRFALMDAPLPGIGPWRKYSRARYCGISALAALTWSAWLPAANASTSIASGTSFRPIQSLLVRLRANIMPSYTLSPAQCMPVQPVRRFDQDVIDNKAFVARGKLTMPVLAVGGEKSFGPTMAVVMRVAATDVQERVILASGHWLIARSDAKQPAFRLNPAGDSTQSSHDSEASQPLLKGLAARSEGSRPATACCLPDPRGAPCQPRDCRCVRFEKFFASSMSVARGGHRIAAAVGISRYTVASICAALRWSVSPGRCRRSSTTRRWNASCSRRPAR